MTTFNFNAIKRSYMEVILPDEEQTTLHIGIPKKKTIMRMAEMQKEMNQDEIINDLYQMTVTILNNNREKIEVTLEQASEWFEYEDMLEFFKAFSSFIKKEANGKN